MGPYRTPGTREPLPSLTPRERLRKFCVKHDEVLRKLMVMVLFVPVCTIRFFMGLDPTDW